MKKSPFPFQDSRYPNTPQSQAVWELIGEYEDELLVSIRAGQGAAATLPTDKLRALCPATKKESDPFLRRTGAQVAAFARYHGYKPSERKQTVKGSVFKRVARFEPIDPSAA